MEPGFGTAAVAIFMDSKGCNVERFRWYFKHDWSTAGVLLREHPTFDNLLLTLQMYVSSPDHNPQDFPLISGSKIVPMVD